MSNNPQNKPATAEQAVELGLKKEEFTHICEILGRTPNFTELSIYSVMWSEHCSYKNSIFWLKKLIDTTPATKQTFNSSIISVLVECYKLNIMGCAYK